MVNVFSMLKKVTILQASSITFPMKLAVLIGVATLCACGFHPRGSVISASDIGSIFLDAEPDLTVAEEVREALLDSSFLLAPDRDTASILLRLSDENQTDRVISVTSDGSVSELELTHGINMLVARSQNGEPPVYQQGQASNRIEVAREYTYDETGVLGKENEARILRDEMKRDIVRQIILRAIASLAPSVTS